MSSVCLSHSGWWSTEKERMSSFKQDGRPLPRISRFPFYIEAVSSANFNLPTQMRLDLKLAGGGVSATDYTDRNTHPQNGK